MNLKDLNLKRLSQLHGKVTTSGNHIIIDIEFLTQEGTREVMNELLEKKEVKKDGNTIDRSGDKRKSEGYR